MLTNERTLGFTNLAVSLYAMKTLRENERPVLSNIMHIQHILTCLKWSWVTTTPIVVNNNAMLNHQELQ